MQYCLLSLCMLGYFALRRPNEAETVACNGLLPAASYYLHMYSQQFKRSVCVHIHACVCGWVSQGVMNCKLNIAKLKPIKYLSSPFLYPMPYCQSATHAALVATLLLPKWIAVVECTIDTAITLGMQAPFALRYVDTDTHEVRK